MTRKFNPPPGWPKPPDNWSPPKGWAPEPSWPEPPPGWQLWLSTEDEDSGVLEFDMDVEDLGDVETVPSAGNSISKSSGQDEKDLRIQLALLKSENDALRARVSQASSSSEIVLLDDEQVLQEVGIYRYHHPLENAAAYKEQLGDLSGRIAELIKLGKAIEKSNMFTFDNSLAKGRKMTKDLSKLMLRAYNAEADNSLRSLRSGNVNAGKKRLEASRTAIAKLGRMMEMQISDSFHKLRQEEIELTADYLMKKQEEREAAREERARLREERKIAAELAAEREQLDKERSHLSNALDVLRESGQTDAQLEKRLAQLDDAIAQNDFRVANIRAGYVYVISNRGAFGKNVVKIGLTRRLEPIDRVNELGGASVPFRFDVHALFFSEDAVGLESEMHSHFSNKRVNCANSRKEFFFASPSEVRSVLLSKVGNLLEFKEHAESTEFLQSLHYWPEDEKTRRN